MCEDPFKYNLFYLHRGPYSFFGFKYYLYCWHCLKKSEFMMKVFSLVINCQPDSNPKPPIPFVDILKSSIGGLSFLHRYYIIYILATNKLPIIYVQQTFVDFEKINLDDKVLGT